MGKHTIIIGCLVLVTLSAGVLVYALHHVQSTIENYDSILRAPGIYPDYFDSVIPPNIAPLNFLVQEAGSDYFVKIHSKQGNPIEIYSRTGKTIIPERPWHKLLNLNRGQQLSFDIYVKSRTTGRWNRFHTVKVEIAAENIDPVLVYRRIHPKIKIFGKMGTYQRNLRNYSESPVLDSDNYEGGCFNCHTFCGNHVDRMLLGIRNSKYGNSALLVENGDVQKIGATFGYTSWHPSGRLATYSINKIRQFFHTARDEVRDVPDLDSLLAYYLVDSKTVKTSPQIAKKDRLETYPTWSPDGCWLYFCSAPILWSDRNKVPPERYDEVKYDLVRVSYDLDHDEWGELETVLSAKDTGLSILLPRISPDGCWLLFCMCDYGSFPVYSESSDLYLLDLKAFEKTGQASPQRLQVNSDQSESWHSWSSNSRWIAFSSKRESGVFTRCYLSYVDKNGKVYKPFVLPQKDPTHYDSCLWTYSVPEYVTEPVRATGEKLLRVVRGSEKISVKLPVTMATPSVAPGSGETWQQRE